MGKVGIRPMTITVAASSVSPGASLSSSAPAAEGGEGTNWKVVGLWMLVAAVGAGVLFGAGYYLLPLIFPAANPATTATPTTARQTPPQALPTSTTSEPISFTHQSFLRSPAASSRDLSLQDDPVTGETYGQRLQTLLQNTATSSALTEINLVTSAGQPASWNQLLDFLGIQAPPPDFWRDKFEPDFTMLAWKDENGSWPVYVLKLKSGGSPLLLQSSVLKLETAGMPLAGLFAFPPGTGGSFEDAQLNGQPARISVYSQPAARLVYGWAYNQYLLIGTSEGGWKAALRQL